MANIIISPGRYAQGRGEIKRLAGHLEKLGTKFFIIGTESGLKRVEDDIKASFAGTDLAYHMEFFHGECSKNEIEKLCAKAAEAGCDGIVGIGGGKTLDTAKAVAYYQNVPVAIVPTIASTDAPCSALSVLYSDEGVFEEYLFLPTNPNIVIMDTEVIAKAPARLLVAGMGDALATYFEGRAAAKANADNCAGGKCTLAALGLAKLCYETLIDDGLNAKIAAENHVCTKALEHVVEANTLLSGLGFESAGLAGAHAIHNGLTAIPQSHERYHGEKVAFGTLVQLVLENAPQEEMDEVLYFCKSVGLPVTLKELGITEVKPEEIRKVAELACAPTDTMGNLPFPVDADAVYAAIIAADAIGQNWGA